MNIKEILLDKNNKDSIDLLDEQGKKTTFEQVAVIPHKHRLYCVLKPIDHIDGVGDDEAIVFFVDESKEEPALRVEFDELEAIKVFRKYYKLLSKARKKMK